MNLKWVIEQKSVTGTFCSAQGMFNHRTGGQSDDVINFPPQGLYSNSQKPALR
jgi:hypothetical protein